ncbi:MAG TPA: DUF6328 family protein [Actinotalea caeni]|uniref:DUF6328 family protein n=1 Tax=Actinotalea caeni TaxID=1348467 RepID=UPI0012E26F7E|nr:DUF6328 family protein [Actinotalea caeni]HLV55704.1 DUF6328 family protein [Actinotalea caeni]
MSSDDDGLYRGRPETENQRLDRNWAEILQELRVALTGTQLVSGFLLAVAFQQRFGELDRYELVVYLSLVALAALATAVGLAPVVLHRALFRKLEKERVVRLGNRYLTATAILVAVLAVGVSHLIFDFVVGRGAGVVAAVLTLVAVLALWVLPLTLRARR